MTEPRTSKNNYRNRRERGQCAMCTNPSPDSFRCPECKVKYNAYMREMRFKKSIERDRQLAEREQRLAEIETRIEAEVKELERRFAEQCKD